MKLSFNLPLTQNDIKSVSRASTKLLQKTELYLSIYSVPGLEFHVVMAHGGGSGEDSMGDVL